MSNTHVLVTGGAGYIGQAVVEELVNLGFTVTVVDRKTSPYIAQLEKERKIFFHQMDYVNIASFGEHQMQSYDYIIHLAASHQVSESMHMASDYYENNITKFKILIDHAYQHNLSGIIFSGSSSVYGNNSKVNTDESTLFDPTSPYASTKAIAEYMLSDYHRSYQLPYVSLRYFNAAGADPEMKYGYSQGTPSHLVPCIVRSLLDNKPFVVYGNDYPTPDGTAIRSYTHVKDIAKAHVLALQYMERNLSVGDVFNIGHHEAYSVKQVVETVKQMYPEFEYIETDRRPGDSIMQSADNSKSSLTLGWKIAYNIKDMLTHEINYQTMQRKQNG